jgi:hypothetical protein
MVPVVLRPYSGEILYSWLARTAAVYGVDHSGLLGFRASPWDFLAAPAPETLRRLAEFTRMPETALADLTIAGTHLPQRWWSIRQITPDSFAPKMEYTYHPTITFCRLCLWNDFITDGNEYLRVKWMAAVPTICPLHRVPMEDSCNSCSAWGLPISVRTSRGSRFVCADCKRPLASPQISGRTTASQANIALLARNRLGLLSYIAALAGGRPIRERLLLNPAPGHSGMTPALSWLRSSDRRTLRRRVAAWPQIQRNTVFSAE